MFIVGYRLQWKYFPWGGFEEQLTDCITVHKECAWNHALLFDADGDCVLFEKILLQEASGLTCEICKQALTEKACFDIKRKEKG